MRADPSLGGVMGLTAMVVGVLNTQHGIGIVPACLIGLAVAVVAGCLNGFFVVTCDTNALIVLKRLVEQARLIDQPRDQTAEKQSKGRRRKASQRMPRRAWSLTRWPASSCAPPPLGHACATRLGWMGK